ncbi:MAG: LPS assembly lipoprotein LptE [Chlorobi bacterium]|nr:LPS assembly lipoprotein LptE [Chlorobiota bacterium]
MSAALVWTGCYSLVGGSVPPHLKTIAIATVADRTSFGQPVWREVATQLLIERFRNDNTLQLVDRSGDAELRAALTTIAEEPVTLRAGEVERERKIRVAMEVEYYDAVKSRTIWRRTFTSEQFFLIAQAAIARDQAIRTALEQIASDVLLAVISDW